jgi:hypothetical protein
MMPLISDVSVLYRYGSVAFPEEVDDEIHRGVAIADTYVQSTIASFLKLTSEDRYAHFAAYQAEVQTDAGTGFVLRHNAPYDPTCDLTSVLVRVRRLVVADKYQPETVVVGNALYARAVQRYSSGPDRVPLFERGTALADARRGIRAGIGLFGLLRPDMHSASGEFTLSIDVFECRSENDAQFLLDGLRGDVPNQVATGVVVGQLLGVIVASEGYSTKTGGYVSEVYETVGSLGRFEQPLRKILQSVRQD